MSEKKIFAPCNLHKFAAATKFIEGIITLSPFLIFIARKAKSIPAVPLLQLSI
jgi:hypothetical protein